MTSNKTIIVLLSSACLALGAVACKQGPTTATEQVQPGSASGINLAAMDKSVKPGDDFFSYANGSWVKNTPIPDDRSSIGGFLIADQKREADTKALFDEILKADHAAGSNEAKIKDFYNAYLNTDAIDKAGLAPAKADLDAIAAINDKTSLSRVIGSTLRADTDPLNATNYETGNLFGIFVSQGLNTPGETIPYLMQGGLGMPEREYYLGADNAELRGKYRTYVETVMNEAGSADPKAAADRIIALETKIAQAHVAREISEDFKQGAQVWTRADLDSKAPGIDWNALLTAAQLQNAPKFQAYHAGAIPKLSALVASQPLDAWKDWLTFHTLNQRASVLPAAIRDASFAFNGQALSGQKAQRPRDVRALNATSNALEDAVGKAYVEKVFPASSKADITRMVDEIKQAFATRVQGIDWMADSTKAEAVKKIETMGAGIGYPEKWAEYSFTVSPTDAYANAKAAELDRYRRQIAKIGKPMDKLEWWMPAQLVNAVNLPVQNAMNFPAAILQPPFYNASADPAYNYGAIGAVIGHEISHSFDNNGAAFDSTGNMRNWWTPADFAKFEAAGKALAEQYDTYEPFPGVKVNGKLTLGENIADVAGLQAAYDAYKHSLGGKEAPVIDGFTGDQRFFIAYAQTWATKMRDEALKARIATDGHAPGQYRAQTVRNIDAWYNAFNVQPGDKLYLAPEKRVKVWG